MGILEGVVQATRDYLGGLGYTVSRSHYTWSTESVKKGNVHLGHLDFLDDHATLYLCTRTAYGTTSREIQADYADPDYFQKLGDMLQRWVRAL